MPRIFAIYVPATRPAQHNLEIGLQHLVWGWKDSALDRADVRRTAESIAPGDLLVMGSRGPTPRVSPGRWGDAQLGRVFFIRAVTSVYNDVTTRWPDEIYPNRIDLEILTEATNQTAADLGAPIMEALRLSANTMGAPVLAGTATTDLETASLTAEVIEQSSGELDHAGAFDALSQVLVRREQRKIRSQKFGEQSQLTCDICGRTLPSRLIRAAHIKQRSKCGLRELRDLHNIMGACVFGCDEMFEHGYIGVDDTGRVVAVRTTDGDLRAAVAAVEGRHCRAHTGAAAGYFDWHRRFHLHLL